MRTCFICGTEQPPWRLRYVIANFEIRMNDVPINRTLEGWACKTHGNREVKEFVTGKHEDRTARSNLPKRQPSEPNVDLGTVGEQETASDKDRLVDSGESEGAGHKDEVRQRTQRTEA